MDNRIRVIHKQNEGASVARNIAVTMARGEYISFVDSDDVVDVRLYEVTLSAMKDDRIDIAFFHHCTQIENLGKKEDKETCILDAIGFTKLILRDEIGSQLWQFLFKAGLWKNIASPAGRLAQDMMVIHQVTSKADRVILLNDILYYYFENNQTNVSNSNKGNIRGTVDRSVAFWMRTRYCSTGICQSEFDACLSKAVSFSVSCFCREEFLRNPIYSEDRVLFQANLRRYIGRIVLSKQILMSKKLASILIFISQNALARIYTKHRVKACCKH